MSIIGDMQAGRGFRNSASSSRIAELSPLSSPGFSPWCCALERRFPLVGESIFCWPPTQFGDVRHWAACGAVDGAGEEKAFTGEEEGFTCEEEAFTGEEEAFTSKEEVLDGTVYWWGSNTLGRPVWGRSHCTACWCGPFLGET